MEENKCFIPVVCQGCNEAKLDLLFEGGADQAGIAYALLHPITDYQVLYVELQMYCTDEGSGWVSGTEVIANPKVTDMKYSYGKTQSVAEYLQNGRVSLNNFYFHFPAAATLMVDGITTSFNCTNNRIGNIYGMK